MEDFKSKYMKDKIVEITLPSSPECIFKIKKISMRKLCLDFKKTLLFTNNSIKLDDNKNVDMSKFTDEQMEAGLELNCNIIMESVIYPKITREHTDNNDEICIDDLPDEDFNFLLAKIQGLGEKGATDLKPFREESNADNTGQDGETVQPTAN